jgi:hypothetical protein
VTYDISMYDVQFNQAMSPYILKILKIHNLNGSLKKTLIIEAMRAYILVLYLIEKMLIEV